MTQSTTMKQGSTPVLMVLAAALAGLALATTGCDREKHEAEEREEHAREAREHHDDDMGTYHVREAIGGVVIEGNGGQSPYRLTGPTRLIDADDGSVIDSGSSGGSSAPPAQPVHPDVAPVAAGRLLAALPEAPAGWSAYQASAGRVATHEGDLVEASRSYWKGPAPRTSASEGQPSVDITVQDRGQVGVGDVQPSTPEGQAPADVTIAGMSGMQVWSKESSLAEIVLVKGGRFVVRARGSHVTPDDLKAWIEKMPLGGLGT